MTERTWEKYGAGTGIAFGILLVVSLFVAPQPPHIDASADKIIAYYRDNRTAVITAGVVSAFAGVAAILFIAHLRHIFDRVENGIEGLSTSSSRPESRPSPPRSSAASCRRRWRS